MIRKWSMKNTKNPPGQILNKNLPRSIHTDANGQIVNPIPDPINERNIEQWKEYESSRNTIDPRFPAAHYEHDLFPEVDRNRICDECETVSHCSKNGCIPKVQPK